MLFNYSFSIPMPGDNFNFPNREPNKYEDSYIYSNVYSSGDEYIKLFKHVESSEYSATCESGDVLENEECYKDTGDTYDINATLTCVLPNKLSDNNITCIERSKYEPQCNSGDYERNGKCKSFNTSNTSYGVEVSKNGLTHMMKEGTYPDPGTGEILNASFHMNVKSVGSGFTCNALKGQIQEGDVNNNLFSSENDCEAYCFIQNDCATVSDSNSSCIVTDKSFSDPVTDWTGKTVYTKSSQTLKCTSTNTQQTGCDEYKITNNFGTVSYDLSEIGWKYSEYDGLEKATTDSLMTEQMQHLFSGWPGYCESGMLFSNPFNDPMKILSYAMMAYSAAGEGFFW